MTLIPQMTVLPPVDENARALGSSGYKGADAKELARLASKTRDVELTSELFLRVCDRLVEGETLTMICADRTMPSTKQFNRYLYTDEKALDTYYRAREMQMECYAEEALTIANDDSDDSSIDDRGRRISHNEVVQRARVKIDTIKFMMSKMAPKRFGDKNFTEIAGNPDQPVTLQVVTGVPRAEGSLIHSMPTLITGPPKSIKDDE